jgi:TPR repeat protein
VPLYRRFIVLLFLSSSIAFAQTTSAAPASIPSQQEISELKVKAESGDPKAQVKLGQFYEDGTGLPVNHAAAVNWYRRAAEQKDPAAENNLGIMYRLGQGVDKDLKESVQWFRKAARQGYPNGCFNLGTAYYNGDGVPPNVTRAYAWFAIAKHLGSPSAADAVGRLGEELGKGSLSDAYVQTGRLLEAGEEVPQDLVEAANWYRKAADASDPTGQWKLAALYSAGRGVPKDPAMGAMWRAKVLKSPQPEFMVDYGNMLRTGTDVPQDLK